MKVVAIIQARMGSTRLPGKVLMDIAGKTMLARVIERTQRTPGLNEIIVATTVRNEDDAIIDKSRSLGVATYRGSEEDVLDRYYQAATKAHADVIIRVTSDCPLIDPGIIGEVLHAFTINEADYASNVIQRTYPRGLDTEVVSFHALERAWLEAQIGYQREHVTPYIYENPSLFKLLDVTSGLPKSYGHWRWTVDTEADLQFVRAVYERFPDSPPTWLTVAALLTREPALLRLNKHIRQKPLGRY